MFKTFKVFLHFMLLTSFAVLKSMNATLPTLKQLSLKKVTQDLVTGIKKETDLAPLTHDLIVDLYGYMLDKKMEFDEHSLFVSCLSFAPNSNNLLASCSYDQTIKLWDLSKPWKAIATLRGHQDFINQIAFSPDGRWLASCSRDNCIKIWDLSHIDDSKEDSSIVTLTDHTEWINCVKFSPNGKLLVSGDDIGIIKIWDISKIAEEDRTIQCLQTLDEHKDSVNNLDFSPNGQLLVSCAEHAIKLWDVVQILDTNSSNSLLTWTGHKDVVRSVKFSPNGKWLASCSHDRTVKLCDITVLLDTTKSTKPFVILNIELCTGIEFSNDSKWLITNSHKKGIMCWNMHKINKKGIKPDFILTNPAVYNDSIQATNLSLAFSADDRYLATYLPRTWKFVVYDLWQYPEYYI